MEKQSNMYEMYLVDTDERSQKRPELEVVLVVEQRGQTWRFGEHLPERWGHFKTALNQVANTEHPDEALDNNRNHI